MDFHYYAITVLLFVAVALAIEATWQLWFSTQSQAARRLSKRLQEVRAPVATGDGKSGGLLKDNRLSDSVHFDAWLRRMPGAYRLHAFLQQAGVPWTVSSFLMAMALAFVSGTVLAMLFGMIPALAFLLGLALSLLPWLVAVQRREKRLKALEMQLPEAADLISRSLRAGHAFPATLQMLADEMPDPIAAEFRIVSDEVNFGLAMSDALQRLAARVPLADLQYLVVAVLIQREAGGNLSELMSKVSLLVRQRLKLLGDVRVLSAEGRMSAWILCLLPVFVALVFSLISPEYLKRFFDDPAGPMMLAIAVVMMFFGVLWMRFIVRIRV